MFKFLFVMFFFFILLVFLMGFSILRTFKNILFGSGSSGKKGEQRRQTSGYSSDAVTALHEKNMLRRSPVKRFLQKMRGSMWIMRK